MLSNLLLAVTQTASKRLPFSSQFFMEYSVKEENRKFQKDVEEMFLKELRKDKKDKH